jgi:peptide-methionine (S)-S-oxide reductase
MQLATFAAGCFWGTEAVFRGTKGIVKTGVGYMGGWFKNPTYEDVLTDTTGHAEVVQIVYDETLIPYTTLLRMLFKSHNPTTLPGEKYKYRSTIFCHIDGQMQEAEAFLEALRRSDRYRRPIRTTVVKATEYYPAEARHQHYYEKKNRLPGRLKKPET